MKWDWELGVGVGDCGLANLGKLALHVKKLTKRLPVRKIGQIVQKLVCIDFSKFLIEH